MDTPLLALTRRRPDAPLGPSPDTVADNMRQLVQLRWIAVVGQLVTILGVRFGLRVPLPLQEMLGIVTLLALANFLTLVALPRHRVTNIEITLALLLDMAALTLQLYLSGGATNPFILLLLLQVVLGAILLEEPLVWLLIAAAILCYALLSVEHEPLVFPPNLVPEIPDLYTLGAWLGFALAAVLLTLFISRISGNLRRRDDYVAELRGRAAEEDGIVRMGLFASGAAHELGSPLATLSVILSDWRRMPTVASDPELAGEVEEMRAEVERCKAIVSDILHSAGEPRGEAMASMPACAFTSTVVDAWTPTHPATPLDYRCDVDETAALVVDPALRQAIWNLLDNAAEASPGYVCLNVIIDGGSLALSVSDHGGGFSPDQLEKAGKPNVSTKGPGHGVGLFLAANVARRLGGRLEIRNQKRGADVRLLLPLASAPRPES